MFKKITLFSVCMLLYIMNSNIILAKTFYGWGYNYYGQLGDGTTINKLTPIKIGNDTNWLQVSCGNYHTLAIKNDGTLWAWGNNELGQLGDGTTTNRTSPTKIANNTNWLKVSAGASCSFALEFDMPVVSSLSIHNITDSSATLGGNVNDEGDAQVTLRGVCWNTSGEPTIFDSIRTNGSGLGEFSIDNDTFSPIQLIMFVPLLLIPKVPLMVNRKLLL